MEPKNLVRQNFIPADLGENKAKVLAERYSTVFGMETEYVPNFVEDENQLKALLAQQSYFVGDRRDRLAPEQVILIGAVDNNRSRQLCHRVFYQAKELIYIDSGNGSEHLDHCRTPRQWGYLFFHALQHEKHCQSMPLSSHICPPFSEPTIDKGHRMVLFAATCAR